MSKILKLYKNLIQMIKSVLIRVFITLSIISKGLCDEPLTELQQKRLDDTYLKEFYTSDIYKSTKDLSQLIENGSITLKHLAEKAKELKVYNSASMKFGMWLGSDYLNPLPFDLDKKHRYCIITFRDEKKGFFSSILLKLKWSQSIDGKSKADEMLSIMTNFYTMEGNSIEIAGCWFNPWDNKGKLLVKDEREKAQDPATYWTSAIGRKEQLKKSK